MWWGLGSSTGLLVGCGLMGSPYPDSTRRPLWGWVGGWVEHNGLVPMLPLEVVEGLHDRVRHTVGS